MSRAVQDRKESYRRLAVRTEVYRTADGLSAVAAVTAVTAVPALAASAAGATGTAVAAGTLRAVVQPVTAVLTVLTVLTLLTVHAIPTVLGLTAVTAVTGDSRAVHYRNIRKDRAAVGVKVHRAAINRPAVTTPETIQAAVYRRVNVRIRWPYIRITPGSPTVLTILTVLTVHTLNAVNIRVRIIDVRAELQLETHTPRLQPYSELLSRAAKQVQPNRGAAARIRIPRTSLPSPLHPRRRRIVLCLDGQPVNPVVARLIPPIIQIKLALKKELAHLGCIRMSAHRIARIDIPADKIHRILIDCHLVNHPARLSETQRIPRPRRLIRPERYMEPVRQIVIRNNATNVIVIAQRAPPANRRHRQRAVADKIITNRNREGRRLLTLLSPPRVIIRPQHTAPIDYRRLGPFLNDSVHVRRIRRIQRIQCVGLVGRIRGRIISIKCVSGVLTFHPVWNNIRNHQMR